AGMSAIKRSGGITIVQDPNEAEYPDMPLSVISSVDVDYVVSLTDMGNLLEELLKAVPESETSAPDDVIKETEISEKVLTNINSITKLASPSVYTCPDCRE